MQHSSSPKPVCLACGSDAVSLWAEAKDVEYYSVPDTFSFHRCNSCRALSIFPVPEDRLAEIYPPAYYSFSKTKGALSLAMAIKQAFDRRLFKSLFRRIDGSRSRTAFSVLDVGGGMGWLLDQVRKAEPRVKRTMVVDIDKGAREAALKGGHEYFHGRIEDFATADKFDIVLMLNLIEHVRDPVGMLAKAGEMLAPGGIILIKTPSYDSLDARLFRHRHWGGYHCPRHWVIFSPESFTGAAGRAGLKVEELKLTQGAPFWAVSAIHWLKERGWTNVSYEKPVTCNPLFPLCLLAFAVFDFIRLPFMKTSQMFVVLRKP